MARVELDRNGASRRRAGNLCRDYLARWIRNLRALVCVLLIPLASTAAQPVGAAQASQPATRHRSALWEYFHRLDWTEERIEANRPAYRDKPPRETNISDDEVREIQAVMAPFHSAGMVSIGTVVTGCTCEEGAECTDQVWVTVPASPVPRGYLLSRINNLWTIGVGQRWWLDYDQFRKTHKWDEIEKRIMDFPACSKEQLNERPPRGPG